MGMVTLNYTDHMPDGGLLIDLVKETDSGSTTEPVLRYRIAAFSEIYE